jgi:carbonic anhydrase
MGNSPHSPLQPPTSTPSRVLDIENFGTVLECMDGRPLRKVADYLITSFGVRNLDTITTAGMVRHLSDDTDQTSIILSNLDVSIHRHGSSQIAIVAHHDCAGNPVPDNTQRRQLVGAVEKLRKRYPDARVVGLWLDPHWIVEKVTLS